jgi:hypothetical protein
MAALIPEIRTSFPQVETSTEGSWVAANSFIFPGTDVLGTHLTGAKMIAGVIDADSGDYRLYDTTNLQVVAQVLGNVAVFPAIVSLGALSNLPTGEAIFELQLKRNTGSGVQSVAVSYVDLR